MTELPLWLFDLDGTLINSIELIEQSYTHALTEHGHAPLSHDEFLEGLGRPLSWQFGVRTQDSAEIEALIKTYRRFNHAHHDEYVHPYPGVKRGLSALVERGTRVAVVTSKARAIALHGLEHCGLAHLVEHLVGSDEVTQHKPHPEPILHALRVLETEPAQAIYIGDAPADLVAGRAAGCQTGAVGWGPFPRSILADFQPDYWFASPDQWMD